jgi:hypothetical protein
VVAVLDGDFVTEESSRACAGVGDQCFLLREFQFEVITEELREALFDLVGFGLRPDEPEQVVVSISCVTQPPISRILWIPTGEAV